MVIMAESVICVFLFCRARDFTCHYMQIKTWVQGAAGFADLINELQRVGIIHGDIKPLNIFLNEKGLGSEEVFKLGDFGCAVGVAERIALVG